MTLERNYSLQWSYGVTTVPDRFKTTLPITLKSLTNAGFPHPRLFIDGADISDKWRKFQLPISSRWPKVGAMQNWILALSELYYRNPRADRYAIFQDDIVCSRNLRRYLEICQYPVNGYINLYTVPFYQQLALSHIPNSKGEHELQIGWFPTSQNGKGALALVFDKTTTLILLSSEFILKKVLDENRGHKNIDGAVITVLRERGIMEWCHSPSLVQHIGNGMSTLDNHPKEPANMFQGEEFDCLNYLGK